MYQTIYIFPRVILWAHSPVQKFPPLVTAHISSLGCHALTQAHYTKSSSLVFVLYCSSLLKCLSSFCLSNTTSFFIGLSRLPFSMK